MAWRNGDPVVYFVEVVDHGLVKIGITRNVLARFATLQSSSPYELRIAGLLDGDREIETWLHRRFAAEHVRREWFRLVPKMRALIEQLDRAVEVA